MGINLIVLGGQRLRWAKGDNEHAKYTVSSVIFVAQVVHLAFVLASNFPDLGNKKVTRFQRRHRQVCVFVGWALAYSSGGSADLKKSFEVLTRSREIPTQCVAELCLLVY